MSTHHWSARRVLVVVVIAVAAGLLATGCSSDASAPTVAVKRSPGAATARMLSTVALPKGTSPTALAVLHDGQLAIGDRERGRILAVDVTDPDRPGQPRALATVDVEGRTNGQRGLLGLVSIDDALYASWTRSSDGRIVVGRVQPGPQHLVWVGPKSATLANGSHLAVDDQGRIVSGIGDLLHPKRIDDPKFLNGKMFTLDPDGPPDQKPTILTGGWNNPFAFTITAGGQLWVADNAPGGKRERLGRGDDPDAVRRDLPGERAPSALIDLGDGHLGLCGYLEGDLVQVDVAASPPTLGNTLVRGTCRTGAVSLGDGRVAVADGKAVRIVELRT